MTSPADLQKLESRVAHLESFAEQSAKLGQGLLDMIQRDNARMAMLESYRVVDTLSRASRFYPKTRTVIFIGRGTFADNVKYAYLAFVEAAKKNNIRCLYLPSDMHQYEQVKAAGVACISPRTSDWSVEDTQALLGAAITVLGDNFHPYGGRSPVSYALLQGAKTIQLWHGIPLKEIGLNHLFAPGQKGVLLSELLGSSGFFDVLVGPASSSESEWRRSFAFHDFAPIGFPRNDVLFRSPTEHDLINVDRETLQLVEQTRQAGKPVIIYGPTFRDHKGPDWFVQSGVVAFAQECQARGQLFLINLHPFEQGATDELRAHFPHLKFIAPHTDIYPIVKHASVFVTDYSSLAFDMLHVNCPLVFYRPDHAEYMAHARALIPGREAFTPGEIVVDMAGLKAAIDAAIEASQTPSKDTFREARHALRKKLFDHHDGQASQRLAELIVKQLDAMKL